MEVDTGVQQARMLLEREGANQEIKSVLDVAIKSRQLVTLNAALEQAMQLGLIGAEVTAAGDLQVETRTVENRTVENRTVYSCVRIIVVVLFLVLLLMLIRVLPHHRRNCRALRRSKQQSCPLPRRLQRRKGLQQASARRR
jgi:hypothetical protein